MGYYDIKNEGNWYYVHFITSNLQYIHEILGFSIKDVILKNTFILYLRINQLEKIKDISLVKKLESTDKFYKGGSTNADTNFFHVVTAPNTSLPAHNDLFRVVRQDDTDTYVIEIIQNGLSKKKIAANKRETIKILTTYHSVKLVSPFILPQIKNNINVAYTQKNANLNDAIKDNSTGIYHLSRYINDNGITGRDQIITIQDTPIDPYHSMFRDDEAGEIKLNQKISRHRKFVYYGFLEGSIGNLIMKIEENEHGTHVAGIAAGKSNCQNDDVVGTNFFNGNAPDAKILYAGDLNDISGQRIVSLMKSFDSHISTNSWGFTGFDDIMNFLYGKIAQENNEQLFIFAAGNEFESGGYFSVCDPGGSKNVLTVGAIDDFFDPTRKYRVQSMADSSIVFTVDAIKETDPWIEGMIGDYDFTISIVVLNASEGKQCLKVDGDFVSIIYGNENTSFEWVFECKPEQTRGIFITTMVSEVERLLGSTGLVKIIDITDLNVSKEIEHAFYSSAGPANKGIIKPDIVAPGTRINSAKSRFRSDTNHGCRDDMEGDFTFMNGTSMAAPNVAGAVALVREFFQSGRWEGGNVSLNSETMRALMINSCRHPNGEKKPDALFGHGVVDISTILPFDSSFGVQISNQELPPEVENDGHVVGKIEVKSNNVDLQITMSYLDPMLDGSSAIPITNDLDLVVVSSTGRRFLGDNLVNRDTQHFSTNEKVIIERDEIEVGIYYVHVVAGPFIDVEMNDTLQAFAVVATGDIENKILYFETPSEIEGSESILSSCPCENCSNYNNSQCSCDNEHIGQLCQAEILFIDDKDETISLLLFPSEMGRLMVSKNNGVDEMRIKSIDSSDGKPTIWMDDECHVSVGEYETYFSTNEVMSGKISFGNTKKQFCIAIFNNNFESATFEITFSKKKTRDKKGITIAIVFGIIGFLGIIVIFYFLIKNESCQNCSSNIRVSNRVNLEEENEVLTYENNKLREQIKLLNSGSEKLENKDILSNPDNEKLKDQIKLLNSDNQKLKDQIELLNSDNQKLKDQIKSLNSDNKNLKDQIKSLNSDNENLKNQFNLKNKSLMTKNANLIKANRNLRNEINEKDEELRILLKEISNYEQQIIKSDHNYYLSADDIEDFKDKKQIGSGATCIVYKVKQEINVKIDVKRALKVYNKIDDKSKIFDTEKKFVREINILNNLQHPNIVKIYGVFFYDENEEDLNPSILLEYCKSNLEKQIETLKKKERINIIVSICSAMEKIHAQNIIHRDLKLQNILLDSRNNPKIADFGLSKYTDDSLSQSGAAGTLMYMAPETIIGQPPDTKVDVFAFGIILVLILIKSKKLPPYLKEIRLRPQTIMFPEEISGFSKELISDCLAYQPCDRPSFADICKRLKGNEDKLIL